MTLLYRLIRAIATPITRVYFRLRVEGRRQVPRSGGLLVVSNHTSYLDPVILGCTAPRDLHFFARASLFRFPIFGWVIRKLQAIPVARGGAGRAALRQASEVLAGGGALVIFPEGTRSADGQLGPPEPGVGLLALQAGVPIIAAHIDGTHRAMGRGMVVPRPRRIRVRWGEARTPEQWQAMAALPDRPARAIAAALMEEIARLGGQRAPHLENVGPESPGQSRPQARRSLGEGGRDLPRDENRCPEDPDPSGPHDL